MANVCTLSVDTILWTGRFFIFFSLQADSLFFLVSTFTLFLVIISFCVLFLLFLLIGCSPGNDLESIAGQVGVGCQIIFFTTGNGSITNFPFVPTVKIVTTTQRFKLLEHDMDFDAGQYLVHF